MLDGTLYPFKSASFLLCMLPGRDLVDHTVSQYPDFGVCFVLTNDWFYRIFPHGIKCLFLLALQFIRRDLIRCLHLSPVYSCC
jgi:hypothetical protein